MTDFGDSEKIVFNQNCDFDFGVITSGTQTYSDSIKNIKIVDFLREYPEQREEADSGRVYGHASPNIKISITIPLAQDLSPILSWGTRGTEVPYVLPIRAFRINYTGNDSTALIISGEAVIPNQYLVRSETQNAEVRMRLDLTVTSSDIVIST